MWDDQHFSIWLWSFVQKDNIIIILLIINNSINCKNCISSCQLQKVLLKYLIREGENFKRGKNKKKREGGKSFKVRVGNHKLRRVTRFSRKLEDFPRRALFWCDETTKHSSKYPTNVFTITSDKIIWNIYYF